MQRRLTLPIERRGMVWPFNARTLDWIKTREFSRHAMSFEPPQDVRAALVDLMGVVSAHDASLCRATSLLDHCIGYLPMLSRHILLCGLGWLYRFDMPFDGRLVDAVLRATRGAQMAMSWNAALRAGWACLNVGRAADALTIWAWLDAAVRDGRYLDLFPDAHEPHRARLSTLIGLASAHRFVQDVASEVRARDEIDDLWDGVYYYGGRTRIVESAIECYRVDPTDGRRERALSRFKLHRLKGAPHEPIECVRQSLLVALMMVRYVFGCADALWSQAGNKVEWGSEGGGT